MTRTVLVTGGFGFLGRAVASLFKRLGYRVVGLGRGHWAAEEAAQRGFDFWLNANVSLDSLVSLDEQFELVVHCAGNGSVGYSLKHPLQDFQKTVHSTADLLEYVRLNCPQAAVIYPSSAGVYGCKEDAPIRESDPLTPISPYGVHKRIAEDLLRSYSDTFGIRVAVIRFFSIYGPGLTKQLLWDAAARLSAPGTGPAEFWGTGGETRDWISSSDAAKLVATVAQTQERFLVLNGASGVRCTVRDTLLLLRETLGTSRDIVFNNIVRAGDPLYYHADISRAQSLGWRAQVDLRTGLQAYVRWLNGHLGATID